MTWTPNARETVVLALAEAGFLSEFELLGDELADFMFDGDQQEPEFDELPPRLRALLKLSIPLWAASVLKTGRGR